MKKVALLILFLSIFGCSDSEPPIVGPPNLVCYDCTPWVPLPDDCEKDNRNKNKCDHKKGGE